MGGAWGGGGGWVGGAERFSHLSTVWEVSHGSEEGVLGVEDASLAHVPDLETSD